MIASAVAINPVKKSSKSELSSRFSGRLKFLAVFADCAVQCQQKRKNKQRNFLANSADRPGIPADLIMIRTNPGTIGQIRRKVACEILEPRKAQKPRGWLRFR